MPSREYAIEFVSSARRLQQEGLLKHIGLSEVCAEWLEAAHVKGPVCVVQQEWSLLTRGIEDELVPMCKQLGVVIVAYSPLARNLLTAPREQPMDVRRSSIPRFSAQNFEQNQEMLLKLKRLAERKHCTPAQLSMGWLLRKASDLGVACLPIPGTKTLSHALENIASVRVDLTETEMRLLESIAEMSAGARESDNYMGFGLEGATARAKAERASTSKL